MNASLRNLNIPRVIIIGMFEKPFARLLAAFVGLCAVFTQAGSPAVADQKSERDTRLVVLIVVDQLRTDFLIRWQPRFCRGGFSRLMRDGAFFENAHYSYSSSATAPGHASIATGRFPRQHGVVANSWYQPPDSSKRRYAVIDDSERIVGLGASTKARGKSPRKIIGNTIGDQLKRSDARSRVFSVALKDRAAIFIAGHAADSAVWWNSSTGRMVTSTYYGDALPDYIAEMNANMATASYAGKTWKPLLPPDAYVDTKPVGDDWSRLYETIGSEFPHKLPAADHPDFFTLFRLTPFGNDIVFEAARRILVNEDLGRGPATDMLCIGLSANDYCGHAFGPDSPEVKDLTLRTDRKLAELFDLLEENVGLDRCLIVLTADHGVSSAPQINQSLGHDTGLVDFGKLISELNRVARDTLGERAPESPLIVGTTPPFIYCDPAFDKLDRESDGELSRALAQHMERFAGIERAFTAKQLATVEPPPTDTDRLLAWRSFHHERSGRFSIRFSPFWYKTGLDVAGHVTGFQTDRYVPILFHGHGVRPVQLSSPADPIDIAPTMAELLGVKPPSGAVGRVLSEAITLPQQD